MNLDDVKLDSAAGELPDMLKTMLQHQFLLERDSFGTDPTKLRGDVRAHFITWNAYALEDEIHEATQEVGWKPWATSRHLNREAYMKELVDAWHFFMNLMLVAEISAEEFFHAYMEKAGVNRDRQAQGYDGVSSKCERCHRELDRNGRCSEHGALVYAKSFDRGADA